MCASLRLTPYAGGACESAAAAEEFVMGDKSFLAMEIHGWGIWHDQPVFSFLSPPLAREEREKAYFFVSLSPSPPLPAAAAAAGVRHPAQNAQARIFPKN